MYIRLWLLKKKFHMINESIFIDKLRDLVILIFKKKYNKRTQDRRAYLCQRFSFIILKSDHRSWPFLFLLLLSSIKFLYQPCRMCRCINWWMNVLCSESICKSNFCLMVIIHFFYSWKYWIKRQFFHRTYLFLLD